MTPEHHGSDDAPSCIEYRGFTYRVFPLWNGPMWGWETCSGGTPPFHFRAWGMRTWTEASRQARTMIDICIADDWLRANPPPVAKAAP